jgi:histidinol phosphatase-like enzyme
MDNASLLYYKILGFPLEAIYFCPQGPDGGCDCTSRHRKLVRKAMRDLALCAEEVVVIRDSGADRGAAGVTGYAWPPRTGAMPLNALALLTERGGAV